MKKPTLKDIDSFIDSSDLVDEELVDAIEKKFSPELVEQWRNEALSVLTPGTENNEISE